MSVIAVIGVRRAGPEDTHPEIIYEASQRTRNGPKKPDSFFRGFKCSVALGSACAF